MSENSVERKLPESISTATLVRVVIVGITLVMAWFLGQNPSLWYFWFVVAMAGMLLLIRYPQIGIVALVPLAIVVPFSLGTGTQTGLNLAFLGIPFMAVVLFVRTIYYPNKWEALRVREIWPLFGLLITISVSFVSGYLPWNAFAQLAPIRAQLGQLALFAFSVGALVLVPLIIDSERWLQAMVWIFLALGAVYILGRAFQPFDIVLGFIIRESTGSLFWVWMVAFAAGQALFNRGLGYRLRLLLIVLLVLLFGVAFISPDSRQWASGWLPAGVCLAVLLWLRWPRLSVAFGALVFLILILFSNSLLKFVLSGDNAYSLLTRTAAAQILWQIIQVNPLLGVGPANYYYYTPLYSILGYFVSFNSHNQYVDIVAQSGFIGLGFFLWFVWGMGRLCWNLRKTVAPEGFAAGYAQACLGGLAGTLVAGALGDWVIPFVYNVGISGFRASLFSWLFLGGAIVIYVLNKKSEPSV